MRRAAYYINSLETLAVEYALINFQEVFCSKSLLLRSNNATAVDYINNMGGQKTPACNKTFGNCAKGLMSALKFPS